MTERNKLPKQRKIVHTSKPLVLGEIHKERRGQQKKKLTLREKDLNNMDNESSAKACDASNFVLLL